MKKNIVLCCLFAGVIFALASCNQKGGSDGDKNMEDADIVQDNATLYKEASEKLFDLSLAVRKLDQEVSVSTIEDVMEIYDDLDFEYDEDAATTEELHKYKELQFQIDSTKTAVEKVVDSKIKYIHKNIFKEQDHLLNSTETVPFYLKKGEKLYINFETQGTVTVLFCNADSRSTLKTYKGKRSIKDSIQIRNSAIYFVEMKPVGNPYVDLSVEKSVQSFEDFKASEVEVKEEKTLCTAKEFGAKADPGIKLVNVFEEPHKVTLRSQGKAFFSGNSRSVVAMQIPSGSTDVLYKLRISTSQENSASDGKFCKDMSAAYKEIKVMGKTVYEKNWSVTNILREMLNHSEPYREEEAYCNLYVFTDAASAKKFGEGTPVSQLKYDVSLSKQGTQSCNDRVPIPKGVRTLYFGFENTRFRYSVYLWLESVATTPVTEYYRSVYSVDK